MLKRFVAYYKPHWKLLTLDLLASLLISVIGMVYPVVTNKMLNDYIPNRMYRTIVIAGIIVLVLYLIRLLLRYFVQYYGHVIGVRMQSHMRQDLFSHLQRLPYRFYDNHETGRIDYDEFERLAKEHKPKLIVAGASAYPRVIDFERMAKVAHEVGAYFMVDMAHIAGLVAAGVHPSPVPHADIVTTTTHKTLRGPRGGMILCREELGKAIDKAIFPGTQGGPLMHVIAAKAVCFGEALTPEFKAYQQRIVENAAAFAEALIAEGFDLVSGGTDNHLILLDLRSMGITGKELEARMDSVHITANKNAIPNDPEKPFVTSGIRLGTPAATSRGFGPDEFRTVAHLIGLCAKDYENSADYIRAEVAKLCEKFPLFA